MPYELSLIDARERAAAMARLAALRTSAQRDALVRWLVFDRANSAHLSKERTLAEMIKTVRETKVIVRHGEEWR